MEYQDTLIDTISWTGAGITKDNIMAIAVVADIGTSYETYSDPPTNDPENIFDAYYIDACAAADVTNSWPNTAAGDFTHTVFIDEGSATWCTNCHNTAYALEYLFENRDYSFFYAAVITDVFISDANIRKTELNIDGYPTCFFDGGYKVLMGGYADELRYDSLIVAAGEREVPELELTIDLVWLDNETVEMHLMFINNATE
jgi:hypothetical protein